MAKAMKHAVIAGRQAYLAGRMPKKICGPFFTACWADLIAVCRLGLCACSSPICNGGEPKGSQRIKTGFIFEKHTASRTLSLSKGVHSAWPCVSTSSNTSGVSLPVLTDGPYISQASSHAAAMLWMRCMSIQP